MRPRERRDSGEQDLFRSRLDQIIAMNHPLVLLAKAIDWQFLERTPMLRAGNRILIAAHDNSLRGLVKYLSDIDDADIPGFEIPTGNPLIYELDGELRPTRRYFLNEKR